MGVNTVIAGLLHDVLEDTATQPEELEQRFGTTVRQLVEGVTKLHHSERKMEIFNEASRRRMSIAKSADNLRKLLVAVAEDLRVMVIKLADRLHNMQTLDSMPPRKAGTNRRRDAAGLRPTRPPTGHLPNQSATGRPRLQVPLSRKSTATSARRSPRPAPNASRKCCNSSTPSRSGCGSAACAPM
jgi:hypothetical protein